MVIMAVVDRIENENAVLLSSEIGIEVTIPANMIKGIYKEGEVVSLTIDESKPLTYTIDNSYGK